MTTTLTTQQEPTVVLVAGHWLGAWAWDRVAEHLAAAGARPVAITLPGLDAEDPARATRTLDDQAAAIQSTIEAQGGDTVIVAHSGANAPVSLVLDRVPELIRRVVWVDSGPVAPGTAFAAELADSVQELPLPPFELLGQQASLDGLSDADLERFRASAVPEPAPVVRGVVHLTNEVRLRIPTTLVCSSMPGAQVREFAASGHPMFAEVARLEDVEIVDLPTGHWPMWSRPEELAGVICDAARH